MNEKFQKEELSSYSQVSEDIYLHISFSLLSAHNQLKTEQDFVLGSPDPPVGICQNQLQANIFCKSVLKPNQSLLDNHLVIQCYFGGLYLCRV